MAFFLPSYVNMLLTMLFYSLIVSPRTVALTETLTHFRDISLGWGPLIVPDSQMYRRQSRVRRGVMYLTAGVSSRVLATLDVRYNFSHTFSTS